MGWEVKIDMSGQSNDCLRVCNIKMKIFLPDQKCGTFLRMYEIQGCSANQLNFFHRITGDYQSSCCGHILVNINQI